MSMPTASRLVCGRLWIPIPIQIGLLISASPNYRQHWLTTTEWK